MSGLAPPGSVRAGAAESLLRISRALVSQLDFEALMQTVVDEAAGLCGAQLGAHF